MITKSAGATGPDHEIRARASFHVSPTIPPAFVPGQAEQTRLQGCKVVRPAGRSTLHPWGLACSPEGGTKADGMTRHERLAWAPCQARGKRRVPASALTNTGTPATAHMDLGIGG